MSKERFVGFLAECKLEKDKVTCEVYDNHSSQLDGMKSVSSRKIQVKKIQVTPCSDVNVSTHKGKMILETAYHNEAPEEILQKARKYKPVDYRTFPFHGMEFILEGDLLTVNPLDADVCR